MAAVVDQRPHGAVADALCGARGHRRGQRPAGGGRDAGVRRDAVERGSRAASRATLVVILRWSGPETACAAGRSRRVIYFAAAEIAYLMLRRHSNAMTPGNAPDFYQFVFAPPAVFRNILEYADRAATLTALLLLFLLAIVRRRPALDPAERTVVTIGAVVGAGRIRRHGVSSRSIQPLCLFPVCRGRARRSGRRIRAVARGLGAATARRGHRRVDPSRPV